ncbi:hypothetical protein [Jiella pelagia]|uniref:Uncharacterized protein n=1 Tax=Jiella pelagia TaxID=2986949 RepID=A0ABY7C6D4_9HYPH|nr:hypothetical protein [Jiella pelagia]WAP70905.1 hypothetical protein OH818_13550 [Jiella pelagia]
MTGLPSDVSRFDVAILSAHEGNFCGDQGTSHVDDINWSYRLDTKSKGAFDALDKLEDALKWFQQNSALVDSAGQAIDCAETESPKKCLFEKIVKPLMFNFAVER